MTKTLQISDKIHTALVKEANKRTEANLNKKGGKKVTITMVAEEKLQK